MPKNNSVADGDGVYGQLSRLCNVTAVLSLLCVPMIFFNSVDFWGIESPLDTRLLVAVGLAFSGSVLFSRFFASLSKKNSVTTMDKFIAAAGSFLFILVILKVIYSI
jgi:hypothetical protein